MDKNYDNLALGLAIAGICLASLDWLVSLGILPIFFIFIPMILSGMSMIGLLLGILSLSTSEHKWKPILAIVIYLITVIINFIFIIPLTFKLYDEILANLYPY